MVQQQISSNTRKDNYEELIFSINGVVESVKVYNSQTSIPSVSKIRFGGKSPSHKADSQNKLEIIIKSDNPIIKKLIFNGSSPIEKGDEIQAYIFGGEEKKLPYFVKDSETDKKEDEKYKDLYETKNLYEKRELKEKEIVLYLEKIREGEVVRIDYSVDFPRNIFKK